MIAAELKSGVCVVRIHDEYFVQEPDGCLRQADHIVSDAYKRRAKASTRLSKHFL